MTADELSVPLGQRPEKRRRSLPVALPHVIAAALALFFAVFVLWAILGDEPLGGEPMVAIPIDLHPTVAANTAESPASPTKPDTLTAMAPSGRPDAPAPAAAPSRPGGQIVPPPQTPPANTKTVTIIDGKTGVRQEVVIAAAAPEPAPAEPVPINQKFVEMTSHGPIPKIAVDGTRPAEAYARPVKPLAGKADAPRIALIISGLGVSASATAAAIDKLPGPVTLAFIPYAAGVDRLVAHAREAGHEVLLQLPMEPFDYPDNDPGPQTLLTSLTPEQNLDRLYWLMSRFQGYVGVAGAMGARFTASEQAFAPVLRETGKRGLIFVDDGTNPRSLAGRIAVANNLPFARADLVVDAVPTPSEIDHALTRLEMAAREHGIAVGIASALPVSVDHVGKWAKAAESRGLQLVPITVAAMKEKQS